jgi:hypothetical protein
VSILRPRWFDILQGTFRHRSTENIEWFQKPCMAYCSQNGDLLPVRSLILHGIESSSWYRSPIPVSGLIP